MTPKRGLTPATGAVAALLQSQELAQALRPHMAKVRWAEVVGPQVAGVTQVEKVQNGTELVVRVKNSVWANELVLLKGDMLHRLNKDLGGKVLTDIHFKASGLSRKKKPAPTPDVFLTPVPSEDDLALVVLPSDARVRVQTAVSDIKDVAWRERIQRTMLRAARVEQWKRGHGWETCARCGVLTYPTPVSAGPLVCPLCHAGAI